MADSWLVCLPYFLCGLLPYLLRASGRNWFRTITRIARKKRKTGHCLSWCAELWNMVSHTCKWREGNVILPEIDIGNEPPPTLFAVIHPGLVAVKVDTFWQSTSHPIRERGCQKPLIKTHSVQLDVNFFAYRRSMGFEHSGEVYFALKNAFLLLLHISLFATPESYNYVKALPDNHTATAAWWRSKHSKSYTAEEQYSNSHTTAWWKPHNRDHHTAKATRHRTSHSKPTWLKPLNRIWRKKQE